MVLLSIGGVHSFEEHLFLLIDVAYWYSVKNVSVHVFENGHDVAIKKTLAMNS